MPLNYRTKEPFLKASSKMLLGSLALIMVFVGLVVGDTFVTRYQAAAFLNDVRALRPGKSSFEDLVRLRHNYERFSSVDDLACNPKLCRVYFNFDNRWLYRLRVLPASGFGGGITVRDSLVDEVNLGLSTSSGYSAQVVDTSAPAAKAYTVSRRESTPGGTLIALKVHLTPAASDNLRQTAYSFNLACLTEWGGCKDARAMFSRGVNWQNLRP